MKTRRVYRYVSSATERTMPDGTKVIVTVSSWRWIDVPDEQRDDTEVK